jgi:transposase
MQANAPPTIGIDIGATNLHVALSPHPKIPVEVIDLTDPRWFERLINLIPPNAAVAFEPTGGHYSAPLLAVLDQIGCTALQVEHRTTNRARDYRISGVKKDMTDAQALCYIALQWQIGTPPRGVRKADPTALAKVRGLRVLVWAYFRANKECTRSTNRLKQIAHSIWPILGQHLDTYLRAVAAGFVTPTELRDLAMLLNDLHANRITNQLWPDGYHHHTSRRALQGLVKSLPAWLNGDQMREAITVEANSLAERIPIRDQLERLVSTIVRDEPFTRLTDLWLTIPSAGLMDIATIHVATSGQANLITRDQFRAALGCHPQESQSGETKQAKMARQGFRPAKALTHMWVMRLLTDSQRPNRIAKAFDDKKARSEKDQMHAGRQQLCDILSGIARNGTPYDPNLDTQEGEQ